jgi:hypothetical protein
MTLPPSITGHDKHLIDERAQRCATEGGVEHAGVKCAFILSAPIARRGRECRIGGVWARHRRTLSDAVVIRIDPETLGECTPSFVAGHGAPPRAGASQRNVAMRTPV